MRKGRVVLAQLLLITRQSVSLSRAACNCTHRGADKLRDGLPLLRTPLCFSPSPSPDHHADSLSEDPDTSPSAQVRFARCRGAIWHETCNHMLSCATLYSKLVFCRCWQIQAQGLS